jgi:methylase of polypeptide subunit release factors
MLLDTPTAIIATDINTWANAATQRTAVANQASL